MLPEDVAHKVRCQIQESLFAQRAEIGPVHAEPMEVHILQTELIYCPGQPFSNVGLCPLAGV